MSSLFYMDMDGIWDSVGSGLYIRPYLATNPTHVLRAKSHAPEIYVGLLRPGFNPNSPTKFETMANSLQEYFIKALRYANGDWVGNNQALLIHDSAAHPPLDETNLISWLDMNYEPHYLETPYKSDALLHMNINYNFCVIQGHSHIPMNPGNGAFIVDISTILNEEIQKIFSTDLDTINSGYHTQIPFYMLTCCSQTRLSYFDGQQIQYYHDWMGQTIVFKYKEWGLGMFGYSMSAYGSTPGFGGFADTMNKGFTIGDSLLAWGESWRQDPLSGDLLNSNAEHYYMIYIGDPLLKT